MIEQDDARSQDSVTPARAGEFSPLAIGALRIWPPVVLAPMAGITNAPFRRLCREFGAGLYVSEMVTARLLAEGDLFTLQAARFADAEHPRSIQLYGVNPRYIGEAVRWLVEENAADHIDLNFGCPVRKVTRKGGGAAIPLKPNLLRNLVRAAVGNSAGVPVTIKFRMGLNDSHLTYLTAGRIAEEEGCAAVALHARTAAQLYNGEARWETIAELKTAVKTIPVLGNGDIWEPQDALRMMRLTGCDGVVVGRGCLGRPWIFAGLREVFEGRQPAPPPLLGEVITTMRRHARYLQQWFDHPGILKTFRKHCLWYLSGYHSWEPQREKLLQVNTLEELESLLERCDPREAFDLSTLRTPRGKTGASQTVALPEGYLDNLQDDTPPVPEAEDGVSGG